MTPSATTIFKKLSDLEQEVQRLKVQAYFNLPIKKRTISLYSEESIVRAVREVRKQLWREKYGKKVKSLS